MTTTPLPERRLVAYLDESLRQGAGGLYLVAVVVLAETRDLADAAHRVRGVLLPRQHRFHWHAEGERQRRRMLEQLVALGVEVRAYSTELGARSERARVLCLNRMLWDLLELGVTELVIESRQEHNDAKDRRTIATAQRLGRAPRQLLYRFERPHAEPLLWLPDAAAGALAAAVAGETEVYLKHLEGCAVEVVRVEP